MSWLGKARGCDSSVWNAKRFACFLLAIAVNGPSLETINPEAHEICSLEGSLYKHPGPDLGCCCSVLHDTVSRGCE